MMILEVLIYKRDTQLLYKYVILLFIHFAKGSEGERQNISSCQVRWLGVLQIRFPLKNRHLRRKLQKKSKKEPGADLTNNELIFKTDVEELTEQVIPDYELEKMECL